MAYSYTKRPFGINCVSYFEEPTGIGEGANRILNVLAKMGIPYLKRTPTSNKIEYEGDEFRPGIRRPYSINLIHLNAHRTTSLAQLIPGWFSGGYNIGFWNWEFSKFSESLCENFIFFDEIWVPSTFAFNSISSVSPIPIKHIPYPCLSGSSSTQGVQWRERLHLPSDGFMFLFVFDLRSYFDRKNPLAIIEAFRRAFGNKSDACLVLKTTHAGEYPHLLHLLQRKIGHSQNIRLVDATYSRIEIRDLMAACNAYVSLHRSEGFGLTMLDAMAAGKPVIATNYSGNVDFMNERNSLLVDYRLIPNNKAWGPYEKGFLFADPDIEQAAQYMAKLENDREFAVNLGQVARKFVLQEFGEDKIGHEIRATLEAIHTSHRSSAKESFDVFHVAQELCRNKLEDISQFKVRSHRPIFGRLIDKTRAVLRLLLWPLLDRQTAHNRLVNETITALVRSLASQQKTVAEAVKLLDEIKKETIQKQGKSRSVPKASFYQCVE
ncbi:MAG: glycosyltransferase [Deltaproteobacteria bacterium]|nr:glycosyltransferase [Deltaproteobacteria bacterium]